MPRFTIKELMIGISLVAVGLGLGRLSFWIAGSMPTVMMNPQLSIYGHLLVVLLWIGCGSAVGAGLHYPFKMGSAGGWVGLAAALALNAPLLSIIRK